MSTFDYDSLDQTEIGTNDITIIPEQQNKKQPKKDKKKLFHNYTNCQRSFSAKTKTFL